MVQEGRTVIVSGHTWEWRWHAVGLYGTDTGLVLIPSAGYTY